MSLRYAAIEAEIGPRFSAGVPAAALGYWKSEDRDIQTLPAQMTNDAIDARPEALNSSYACITKRVVDVFLAVIALFLALPVLVILAVALWIESGNPFYTQLRLGKNGKMFRMIKLRSMYVGADKRLQSFLASDPELRDEWDKTQKLKHDPRITPLGRILRKTSLDEIPQLINVIKGDMSLIGPRPMLPEQISFYDNPSAYLGLRPGITGLWQVTARNEGSFEVRARIDQRYAEQLSPALDFKIFLATFRVVLRATGY